MSDTQTSPPPQKLKERLRLRCRKGVPNAACAAVGAFSEQYRLQHGAFHTGPGKPYATLGDLWDEDCSYMKGRDFEQPAGFALK